MLRLEMTVKEAKAGFFDTALMESAVDKAEVRQLASSAAFVMTTARRSIRKAKQKKLSEMTENEEKFYKRLVKLYKLGVIKKKPRRPDAASKPGEPPREHAFDSHPHSPVRRLLLFAWDSSKRLAVVGPAIFQTVFSKINGSSKPPAPGVLEEGGDTRIGNRAIHIAPRPFMVPALMKERSRAQKRWENAVTK